MFDTILKNGTIIDGTGEKAKIGDVAFTGEEIVAIGPEIDSRALNIIDCRGFVITPGFVDSQNHSDSYWQLTENPGLESVILQGFSTVVVGHCGASLSPVIGKRSLEPLKHWQGLRYSNVNWESFREFSQSVKDLKPACNVASFVGLSTLFLGTIGEIRPLDEIEAKILRRSLCQALEQGALGLSVGWKSTHEWLAAQSIMPMLLEALTEYKKTLSVHLRDYGRDILNATEEILELSKDYKLHTKISHLKVQGEENWHMFDDLLRLFDRYSKDFEVGFDVYPYDSTNQPLTDFLPNWITSLDEISLLDDQAIKKNGKWIDDTYENIGKLQVSYTKQPTNAVGKTLKQLADNWQRPTGEAVLELLKSGGITLVFHKSLNPEHVSKLMQHKLSAIATDGAGFKYPVPIKTMPDQIHHPRSFYTTGAFLEWSKAGGLKLPEAIAKLTHIPAKLVGLQNKGLLKKGLAADINIIDTNKISRRTQGRETEQFHQFIKHQFINGAQSIADGEITGARSGKFLNE